MCNFRNSYISTCTKLLTIKYATAMQGAFSDLPTHSETGRNRQNYGGHRTEVWQTAKTNIMPLLKRQIHFLFLNISYGHDSIYCFSKFTSLTVSGKEAYAISTACGTHNKQEDQYLSLYYKTTSMQKSCNRSGSTVKESQQPLQVPLSAHILLL